MSLTEIAATSDRVRWRHGVLRPMRMPDRDGWVRLSLLASEALLLGGDEVALQVEVGAGVRLELSEVAGTVAYHGRGRAASWAVGVRVGAGAAFRFRGEPFVVADGADVDRSLDLSVAAGSTAAIHETLALGRVGECGGRLRTRTRIELGGEVVLLEDQLLDPTGTRLLPGMLGVHRQIESVIAVGERVTVGDEWTSFRLLHGAGTFSRRLS